ncbi:MAG: 3-deoxy-manno-octulosonate cytidylyltransferase [Bryobacterales bacterium]|nr:3-deoxy-manno-octulosonate cytidylyltransferase [Bryobacterales bacterium]
MKIIGVIPSRFKSSRLEGKPLADIHGKPMVRHVYEAASGASELDSVVVATDDERIAAAVRDFGGQVVMTRADHACGTDRVAEVIAKSGADIAVNIQGDEPLLDPLMIDECVQGLKSNPDVGMCTLVKRVGEETESDASVVKVVRDIRGRALYFTRSLVPYPRFRLPEFQVLEHIGMYAYTRECLERLTQLPQTPLELVEGLEQLRALENGIAIQTVTTNSKRALVSVDTREDLERVRQIMAGEVAR